MDDYTNDPEWPSTTSRKRKGEADDQEKSCVPSKQSGNTKVCVIHHESVKDDDNLISPRDFNSWTTILNAATLRQYTTIADIVSSLNEHEVPDIAYHRDCRSLFTMKRDLEALSRESKETVRESPSKFRLSSRRSSVAGPSRVYDAICIFL